MHSKLMILGAGPAGYTAAIYAARAMLEPVLITGAEPGGQLVITTDVENYPGFADVIQGPWLMEQMRAQAEHVGARIVADHIVGVNLAREPFELRGDSGVRYTCDTLVIATGARAKWLGLPSETKFRGHGVSACATCDGFFYRGKDVIVAGGGNTAIEEAIYLAGLARSVTIVHRRDAFRGERILQDRLFRNPRISVVWNHVIDDIFGTDAPPGVTGARLRHVATGVITERAADGIFVAIGHEPASDLFRGALDLRANGYIRVTPGSTATSVPGVYAAGDVTDDLFRQAVTAAGMGCMAALEADRYLAGRVPARAAAE
jgi:thioredoxin reductase (NADPH)